MENILNVTTDQVMSVYSGKLGCACGCRGKHSYNSKHVAAAGTYRGYEVKPNEINDRQVTRVLNTLKANAADVEVTAPKQGFSGHYAFYTDNRMYIVYMTL